MSSEVSQAADLTAELDRRYREADKLAKEVENFRDEAVIPALNELRNAGRHLIDCIRPDGTIKNDGQYRAALSHCDRAAYEAAEAGILTCARTVRAYRQTFSNVPISAIVPQFPQIQADVRVALRELESGRDPDVDPATRSSDYMNHFRHLAKQCDVLEGGRDDLCLAQAKIRAEEKARKTLTWRFWLGIGVAVIALSVAIAGVMVTWLQVGSGT